MNVQRVMQRSFARPGVDLAGCGGYTIATSISSRDRAEIPRMSQAQRPLSPHLQIYRLQLTSVLSICHRATGLGLAVGTILLVWWLLAASSSAAAFHVAQAFWVSWIGQLLLLAWSYALFFHLCNGIRHLCWDAGWGFELKTAYRSGWFVVWGSVILTVLAWIAGYAVRGSA
jgi:succinate dehydrogenase / fumarate reductase cytochrome b subunit